MRNIQALDKHLLADEFSTANNLYYALRDQGYAPAKITGMIYRAGRLDGRDAAADSTKKFHAEYHRLKERVKELEAALQADIEDLTPLAELLKRPAQPEVVIIDNLDCATCPNNTNAPAANATQMMEGIRIEEFGGLNDE